MVRFKQSGPRRQGVSTSSTAVVGRSRRGSGGVASGARAPKEAPIRRRKRRMRPGMYDG
jgi:hypothetical protein